MKREWSAGRRRKINEWLVEMDRRTMEIRKRRVNKNISQQLARVGWLVGAIVVGRAVEG